MVTGLTTISACYAGRRVFRSLHPLYLLTFFSQLIHGVDNDQ